MKICAKIGLIYIFTLLSISGISAQNTRIGLPEVEFYDRDIYGGGSQNRKIAQTQSGTLYFANNYGLLSFDGSRWAINTAKDFVGLKSLAIIDKKIFVGSYSDFGFLTNGIKQLTYHKLYNSAKLKITGDFWNVQEYKNSVLFLTERAICIVNGDKFDDILYPKSRFLGMYRLKDRLLILDKNEGLQELVDGKISPLAGGNVFANKAIGAIVPLSNNKFLIATELHGCYIGDQNGIQKWNQPSNSLLSKINIISGAEYSNDYIALGTIQHGVVIIDKNGVVVSQIDKERGLRNNSVLTIFVDKEQNIWCGLDNGIAKIKYNTNLTFINEFLNLGTGYVLELFKGYYYLGTNQGLFRISEQKAKDPLKVNKDFEKISGATGQPWSFYKDDDNLLCGHNLGVLQIDGATAKVITPVNTNGAWCFKPSPVSPNLLLVGTYDGLVTLEKRGKQWGFKSKVAGFDESCRFVEWENNQSLLVAHSFNGVYRLKLNSTYTAISSIDSLAFTDFPDNTLDLTNSLVGDRVLFSSRMGIYSLLDGSKKPERFTKFDTFFEKRRYPSSLKEDSYGNIWFFSINEIGVLRKLEDGSFRKITYPFLPMDGKMVDYFQSAFITDKDNVFLNTKDGFAHYISSDTKDYQQPFNVNISSFVSSGDSLVYSQTSDFEELSKDSIPHFKYKNNAFTVEFSATFFNDTKIQYSTFLKGWDEQQSAWSRNSYRSFSGLSDGDYELIVYSRNSYQVEAKPIRFAFVINPPWYRSNMATGFYLLLLVALIYLISRYFKVFINQIQRKTTIENQKAFQIREERLLHETLLKEKEIIDLNNEKLLSEAHIKEQELANLAVHIVKKNDFLVEINEHLAKIILIKEEKDQSRRINYLIDKINQDIDNESNWAHFNNQINEVHSTFLNKLLDKHPFLTLREQKLAAYIRMGMASKEIASLQNISTKAVENNRYKLRQALQLSASESLADYLRSL